MDPSCEKGAGLDWQLCWPGMGVPGQYGGCSQQLQAVPSPLAWEAVTAGGDAPTVKDLHERP